MAGGWRSERSERSQEAQIMGLLNCGDCPGAALVTRLAQVHLWNAPMAEKPTGCTWPPASSITVPIKRPWWGRSRPRPGWRSSKGPIRTSRPTFSPERRAGVPRAGADGRPCCSVPGAVLYSPITPDSGGRPLPGSGRTSQRPKHDRSSLASTTSP